MARKPYRRIHDVAPRQGLDKVFLITAFAVGAGGNLMLKAAEVHPFAAALFSAGVLVAYAFLTWSLTTLQLEPDTIGDNCYYLGFLFTLISLAATLYTVVQAGAQERAAIIPEVISGFGVALISTIAGVFLRVLMMQVRVDIVAREKEARFELNRDTRTFRTDLAQSVRQIKAFTVESLQHSREREDAMRREIDAVVSACAEQMAILAETVDKAVARAASEATTAAIKSIEELTQAAAGKVLDTLRKGASEIDQRAHALVGEREAVLAEAEAMRTQLREFATALAGELKAATEGIRNAAMADIEAMAQAQAHLSASTEAAGRARAFLMKEIGELTKSIDMFAAATNQHSGALAVAMEKQQLVDAGISDMAARLDAATTQTAAATRRSVDALVSASQHLTGSLGMLEHSAQKVEAQILDLRDRAARPDRPAAEHDTDTGAIASTA